MPYFKPPKSNIHLIARAFLSDGKRIILCRVKGKNWFFLPGGHIENGESAKTALIRELHEEIGEDEYQVSSFLGVCENIFPLEDGALQQEINLVFKVLLPENFEARTKEDDIEFVPFERGEMEDLKILPAALKDGIFEEEKSGKPFFKSI